MCITTKYIAPYNTNNTKGSLCATAYRTLGTDDWCYKYYRYDARGRVIKMWNYIAGLGEKTTIYEYNSQNQITELIYQSGYSDSKKFKYDYDYAGRLLNASISYIPQDSPEDFMVFNSYTYNQNSQINTSKFDPINLTHTYSYDSRNRITNYSCSKPDLFSYNLTYYSNSNIQTQSFTGQYKDSFSYQDNLSTSFTYDKSNRLLNANFTHTSDNTFDLTNTFDPDGNIITMQRYGSNNNLTDNFTYDYYTGTNRLKKVSGSSDQYTYDYNGNQTNDYLNNNTSIKYDHRNLITEFTKQDLNQDPPITDVTRYKYDEAGNRVRKTIYRSNDSEPFPLPEENEDLPTGWDILTDEYYSRDISGKEIAIYSSYTLQYWNVWFGGEIVGRINNNENADRNYYLKDHLGSNRVVLDNNKSVISANDYDMWGYYLQNRTYSTSNTKNKFTGKEHDSESSWDYFGARYYDSRVGNWGSIDPLTMNQNSFSPYLFVIRNPLKFIDPKGLDIDISNLYKNEKSFVEDLIKNLGLITGLSLYYDNGLLKYKKDINGNPIFNNNGSKKAREYLIGAINSSDKWLIETGVRTLTEVGGLFSKWNTKEIDNFSFHGGLDNNTLGYGMSFIHELLHTKLGISKDDNYTFGLKGDVVTEMNFIREELGGTNGGPFGERLSYVGAYNKYTGKYYIPFDKESYDYISRINNGAEVKMIMGKYVSF